MDLTAEQKALLRTRIQERCIRLADGDVDAALSAAEQITSTSSERQLRRLYRREFGTTLEERRMRGTLRVLDRALARTAPQREAIALALEEQEGKPATVYGMTGPLPLFPAVSEQTDAALLYGEPEVGAATEGALQTAKEQAGRKATHGKQRAKGKAGRKRRGLFKRLRVKGKEWSPPEQGMVRQWVNGGWQWVKGPA